ncbi:formyltransferase family protein [Marinobacterium jannaschii]|uniref:formyltransferase family protein n=1 Tax=Marinobacterium jannaschii TaxID=64970 RepID=UPI00048960FA|nr:formyltransferase family protein [Marinobacterium jannaschii]
MNSKKIVILTEPSSWILPHARSLSEKIFGLGYECKIVFSADEIENSWICFILGFTKLLSDSELEYCTHNLVVHESDLPQGKGFAPMAWQILEGSDEITFTLFEASGGADSGRIWLKKRIKLAGTELCSEWRNIQGNVTESMCIDALTNACHINPTDQPEGGSFYKRRTPSDSEIDVTKTIASQFELLRVVDNERYPAFFFYRGKKYKLKIEEFSDE